VLRERDVLKDCLEYLNLKGVFAWRNNTGAVKVKSRFIKFGYKGSSDIIGILPNGRFLAIECKRENGGVLSQEQKEFLQTILKNKGLALVVHSVEELQKFV